MHPTLTAEEIAAERWRVVVGRPDYEVSDFGRVRTLYPRFGSQRMLTAPRLVMQSVMRGYRVVGMRGKPGLLRVHRLVLAAFVGPCPAGMEGAHANGDRGDNRLSNLSWKTPRENMGDQYAHGTRRFGEKVHSARLTEAGAREAVMLARTGLSHRAIAERLGVVASTVGHVLHGRTWAAATADLRTRPDVTP